MARPAAEGDNKYERERERDKVAAQKKTSLTPKVATSRSTKEEGLEFGTDKEKS